MIIEGLNEQQSRAALAVNGPVIVFAGAGSGKTKTLTYRIAHMIVDCQISPHNILAITFTNKATNEMRERLNSYPSINQKAITISTFHAFCAMILRREIEFLGYPRDFTIIDEEDQLKIISDILEHIGSDKKRSRHFQKMINFNKCFMAKPGDVLEREVFDAYEAKMFELAMLDFEDLLIKVYQLFSDFPEVLFKYQNKYQYILVDEFQDTNLIQYKIIRLLSLENRNIFVVGDDDQSIYSFRGTNYENMNLFKEDFKEYQLFTLTINYRSTQTILNVCNRLIANNKNREPKDMVTSKQGEVDDVVIYAAQNEVDEVNYICESISSLKTSHVQYSDFAILYRSSVLLRNVELGLIKHGLPYKVYGGVSYLRRREVKDIIAYFKLMLNANDVLSFKRIVNVPARGIGILTIEKIDRMKKIHKLDMTEAVEWSKSILPPKKYEDVSLFMEMIKKYALRLERDNLLDIFDDLVSEIEYYQYLKSEYEKTEAEERIANLLEFKSILYNIETKEITKDKMEKLKEAFDNAVLADDNVQNQTQSKNGITVSTIHSVKGLEFSYAFLMGLEEDVFPNSNRLLRDDEIEEERRIAYVAMTRAKKKLFLTQAKKRMLYGKTFGSESSRFLLEALGVNEVKEKKTSYQQFEKKEPFRRDTSQDTGYSISDVVIHKAFGEGIILSINNGVGQIFFKQEKTTKQINLSNASLSKK